MITRNQTKIKAVLILAAAALATIVLTANADDILSSEDWEAATTFDDYANTDYDAVGAASTHIYIDMDGLNENTSQVGVLRGNTAKTWVLRDPLPLDSGGYTSVDITFAVAFTGYSDTTAMQLEYSALGDFSDMQVVQVFSSAGEGSPYSYNQNTWYAGQTVTLAPDTYTFTDTAKITWRMGGGAQSHRCYLDDIVITGLGGGGPKNISPEDGSTLEVGTVDLLWENMDPNNPADPVYVDVWFGTDPDPKNGAKVVDAEPNVTSVTVSAPTEGPYYWQVGNYIHGSATGDPCEGDVWSFNAADDLPPSSVGAGVDMLTWSGEPVSLDATVVDDGKSALTYAWSANPSDGVVFVPSAAVEDPTVTITKATLDPSTVTLTLAVNDESYNPTPVEDTMDIDVYDDACQAAIGKGLDPIGPADFDSNCITDLKDYAVFAAKWLVDYALTTPIPKP